jgi:hypothetical protein
LAGSVIVSPQPPDDDVLVELVLVELDVDELVPVELAALALAEVVALSP